MRNLSNVEVQVVSGASFTENLAMVGRSSLIGAIGGAVFACISESGFFIPGEVGLLMAASEYSLFGGILGLLGGVVVCPVIVGYNWLTQDS